MIYTSYFSRKDLPKEYTKVSIARHKPSWVDAKIYKLLAPNEELLEKYKNKQITDEQYTNQYLHQLSSLDPLEIYQDLITKYGKNLILLCYERYDFCHRRIVKDWLNDMFIKNEIDDKVEELQ